MGCVSSFHKRAAESSDLEGSDWDVSCLVVRQRQRASRIADATSRLRRMEEEEEETGQTAYVFPVWNYLVGMDTLPPTLEIGTDVYIVHSM